MLGMFQNKMYRDTLTWGGACFLLHFCTLDICRYFMLVVPVTSLSRSC